MNLLILFTLLMTSMLIDRASSSSRQEVVAFAPIIGSRGDCISYDAPVAPPPKNYFPGRRAPSSSSTTRRPSSHYLPRPTPGHGRRRGITSSSTASFAIPGFSSLVAAPHETSTVISPQALAASASAFLTYLSLIIYFDRPRGYLALSDAQSLLIVRPSRVPGAGLGLFASRSIPRGTVLGTYAGVLRPARAFYDGKCQRHPGAVGYSWRFTDDAYVIDPTDGKGQIGDVCLGGSTDVPFSEWIFSALLGFWSIDTRLCRINEPPIGAGGCSVSARENLDKREVVFELIQDVVAGQELYLDYGLDYDRSAYGPSPRSDASTE